MRTLVFMIVSATLLFTSCPLGGVVPTSSDADQASGLCKYIKGNFEFESRSALEPDRPPLFSSPGTREHTLIVYTLVEKAQQDRLLDLIREYKKHNKIKPVVVQFYRAER